MEVSKRINEVIHMVSPCEGVADIGTDHGYIAIGLVKEQLAKRAIAMDVNKGPLSKAKENVALYGLNSQIDLRLSDGLDKLKDEECNTIVIAGMGGELIIKILKEGSHALQTPKELILQPQSEIYKVREYLHQIGYKIVSESMLKEDGKFYTIIKGIKGEEAFSYSPCEYQFGKLLLQEKHPILLEYLLATKDTYEKIRIQLEELQTEKTKQRKNEVENLLTLIKEGLSFYENT